MYIFWILHQTTTFLPKHWQSKSCISFESYIKPQPYVNCLSTLCVVYLLNPTSNHNLLPISTVSLTLYIFWILHQTTTIRDLGNTPAKLYIFWILHQTTTDGVIESSINGCISFESYIKPQPDSSMVNTLSVVYLLNPTSNHNLTNWY